LSAATCLVTGATGSIGPVVVRTLHGAGYQIRTLSLDAQEAGLFPQDVEEHVGSIIDLALVEKVARNCELIVHLAALLHLTDHTRASYEEYRKINVEGTDCVIRSALGNGVKRVIFFSTISVYGKSSGETFSEDSVPRPDSLYAMTKLEAEKIVLGAKSTDRRSMGTVLRMAAIYGPRVKGNYLKLLRSLARKRFVPIGNGNNRRTLLYDHDAAAAVLLAARHPAAAGRVYNVTDGGCHSMREIIDVMSRALGQSPPKWHLPMRPVRLAAGTLEHLAQLAGKESPINRAMIDKYAEDLAVSGERIRLDLGFKPGFDLAQGWRETVLKMRQAGTL
jgi:nucleoside-diphosphate-sugar epimerase